MLFAQGMWTCIFSLALLFVLGGTQERFTQLWPRWALAGAVAAGWGLRIGVVMMGIACGMAVWPTR